MIKQAVAAALGRARNPVTVAKGSRRFHRVRRPGDRPYAKCLTARDIAERLEQTYGAKISQETVQHHRQRQRAVRAWRARSIDEAGRRLDLERRKRVRSMLNE